MTINNTLGLFPRIEFAGVRPGGVSRARAAMQRVTVRRIGADNQPGPAVYSKTDVLMTTTSDEGASLSETEQGQEQWTQTRRSTVAFRDENRQRAIAEIEQAYVTLRQAEPTLDPWSNENNSTSGTHAGNSPSAEAHHTSSVWLVIGGIWLVTIAVVGAATAAIAYLVG